MDNVNTVQIGGSHYQTDDGRLQLWDFFDLFDIPFLEANVIKYVVRHGDKHGLEDLRKARHYLSKIMSRTASNVKFAPYKFHERQSGNVVAKYGPTPILAQDVINLLNTYEVRHSVEEEVIWNTLAARHDEAATHLDTLIIINDGKNY